jgi:hypothetical protein
MSPEVKARVDAIWSKLGIALEKQQVEKK